MHMRLWLLSLAGLVAVLSGCAQPGATLTADAATYDYVAFDAENNPVVRGELRFEQVEDGRVLGSWRTNQVASPVGRIGPQVGAGRLRGSVRPNSLLVDLNPQTRGNNVTLEGKPGGRGYAGTWSFVDFRGPAGQGRFELTPARRGDR